MKNVVFFFDFIKSRLRKSIIVYRLYEKVLLLRRKCHNRDNTVIDKGGGRLIKDIIGCNNKIFIAKSAMLECTEIHIWGNNNQLILHDSVRVGKGCSFYLQGDNLKIEIGRGTTFTQMCHFNAQENSVSITVGEDCMFSNHVIVRTSDSHPIYNIDTMERINPAKSVKIGNHVWVAPNSIIMKGASIGDGCIIGSRTMVSKCIPPNTLAVGIPAKVVKEGVIWKREDLFSYSKN